MNALTPADGDFELLPSPEPGIWQFRVARAQAVLGPDSGVAAGTTYANATGMSVRPRLDTWSTYVAAQVESAGGGHVWQYFVRALPSTPAVTEGEFHRIWGRTYVHTYFDLVSNTRPERGDSFSVSGTTINRTLSSGANRTLSTDVVRTLSGTRPVLDVHEQDLGNGLCEVKVVTVPSATVTVREDGVNEMTGVKETTTRTWTLSGTKPEGAGVDASGQFTVVTREEHNVWLSVTAPVSGYPVGQASAISWPTLGRMYWPAVLKAFRWTQVWDSVSLKFKRLLSYSMKDPYAGDVPLTVTKWWQKDRYAVPVPPDMSARSIQARGNLDSLAIPECLHGPFYYIEQNYIAETVGVPTYRNVMMSWWFTSTPLTDWPSTFTRITQEPRNGGFDVTQETFTAPVGVIGYFDTGLGTTGSTWDAEGLFYRDWVPSDGSFYA